MIYTEEDLEQAYAMGYNVAVDDVNAYIELCNEEYDDESMDFSLDESYDNDDDYSAVEDVIMNETSCDNKKAHTLAAIRRSNEVDKKIDIDGDKLIDRSTDKDAKHRAAIYRAIDKRFDNRNSRTPQLNLHVKDNSKHVDTERQKRLKEVLKRNKLRNAGLATRGGK